MKTAAACTLGAVVCIVLSTCPSPAGTSVRDARAAVPSHSVASRGARRMLAEADPIDAPHDAYGRPLTDALGPIYFRQEAAGWVARHADGRVEPARDTVSVDAVEPSIDVPLSGYRLGPYSAQPVGSWPEAVAIGDVTGDGRPDVVMTTTFYFDPSNDYCVFVFPQRSDGTLGTPIKFPYLATANRNGIALVDLDEDGTLDVVVGHGQGITVLLADGHGSLRPGVVTLDADANTLAATDVDRDGHADIISLGWSRGASIFYGDGHGGFVRKRSLPTNASGYNDHEVGDLTGDGVPDLAVMSGQLYATPNLTIHRHDGVADFVTPPDAYFMGSNQSTAGVGLGDVTGDGRTDAVLSCPRNSPTWLWIMTQDESGRLTGPTTISSYDIPEPVEVVDMDGDAREDVAVLHGGWNALGVYTRQASGGGLGPEVRYPVPYASHYAPQGFAIGDFTSDGCPDVAIADYNHGLVVLRGIDCPQVYALALTVLGSGTVDKVPDLPLYVSGTSVRITATPATGWHFAGWSGDASGAVNPLSVAMVASKAITAAFAIDTYALDVEVGVGGSVTRSPDQATYDYGTVVTLTATPDAHRHFVGWGGDATGGTNPLAVTMDRVKTITATFAIDSCSLSVNVVGSGTVTKDPDLATYDYGTVVRLQAAPSVGWAFMGWSGSSSGTTNPLEVVMTADQAISATFGLTISFEFKPRVVNLNSIGQWVTGCLRPPAPYLATQFDVSSVRLNGTVAVSTLRPIKILELGTLLKAKFLRSQVKPTLTLGDSVPVTVTGMLAGQPFVGTDTIKVKTPRIRTPEAGDQLVSGVTTSVTWDVLEGVTSVTMLLSVDDGATWSTVSEDVPNIGNFAWTIPAAASHEARLGIMVVDSIEETEEVLMSEAFSIATPTGVGSVDAEFALRPVNPAMGQLAVGFSLPSSAPATISVLDVSGRKVVSQEVGSNGPGWHTVRLVGLPVGAYVVLLRQGQLRLSARAVVLR